MRPSRRHRRTVAALAFAVAGGWWASCGESDLGGPGCVGSACSPPSLSCPNSVTIANAPAAGEAVTYTGLTETGGTLPVTTTCAPASGATFPVGSTTVNCTSKDAINRSAVCQFTVTLTSSRLAAAHFLAFGDSTTAGENGIDFAGDPFPEVYTAPPCGTTSLSGAGRSIQYFDPTTSYPQQLLNLLKARFASESFTFENEGSPGESAANGHARLVSQCLPVDRPDVLLLLEGINDIAGSAKAYQPTPAEQLQIESYLQSDVSAAIGRGVSFIFVSTILPISNCQPSSGQPCRGADPAVPNMNATANASIDQVNSLIRTRIAGATVIDGNAAFKAADASLSSLIDVDGLHPTAAGYAVLAQTFMTGITGKIPITALRR